MILTSNFDAITMDGCGHITAIPSHTVLKLRQKHGRFYCSTCGAANYFPGESDIERALKAQERAENRAKRAENRAQAEKRKHAATKGHLTRQKKRTAAGVCPCCKRSFRQLRTHVVRQHPQYMESLKNE